MRARSEPAPSTALRAVPLPRANARGRISKAVLATSSRPSLAAPPRTKNRFAPATKREAKRRKAHANHSAPHQQTSPFADASGAAARPIGARPPSGATPRHSPGRTHPPLAQLQFPRFLRPDLAGVTRFDLSRVYRAPRRPVVVPVERWPRAARERSAYPPPAGTALAPSSESALAKGVPRRARFVRPCI
jgi:hypothetical protein